MATTMTFRRFNFGDGWLSWPARCGLLAVVLLAWILPIVSLLAPWTILILVGIGLIDAWQRTEINIAEGDIQVAYPLAPWRPVREFPIDSYQMVGLEKVDRSAERRFFKSDAPEKHHWIVQLEGNEVDPLVLKKLSDEPSVRFDLKVEREAKRIADELACGLRKRVGDEVSEQEAGTLHESLRERAERTGVAPELPAVSQTQDRAPHPDPSQPPGRIKVLMDEDELELTFPAVNSSADHAIAIGGVVTVVGFAALCITTADAPQANDVPLDGPPLSASPWAGYWPFIFLVWPMLTTMIYYLMRSVVDRVRISTSRLSWNRTGALGWIERSGSISAEDLQQVEIAKPLESDFWEDDRKRAVIVRGEHNSFHFGACLHSDEKRWLRDLIVYLMSV